MSSRCTEPTPAERARSMLAAAESLTLTTEAHRIELIGLHAVDSSGRLTLTDPVGGRLRSDLVHAPHNCRTASAEFTDVAPTALRDRVRARLTLGGRLEAVGEDTPEQLCFSPARAVLYEGGEATAIGVDELSAARPDPLATYEADLLTHLDATRTHTAERLSRLLAPQLLVGVVRVRPVRLDRYGLVLRLESEHGHEDARLAFPAPVSHPGQAVRRIRELLVRAAARPPAPRRAPRRAVTTPSGNPGRADRGARRRDVVAAIIRAAPAAATIYALPPREEAEAGRCRRVACRGETSRDEGRARGAREL
ncbi:DUF2470 domain-containing protein [Streptomyces cavernicola]|uniref:DUF2470 domain-containing protein n=1 Tax=Streptomyces cavernicola TaxID=3043613 RepID=A0ABT6SI07_9ACTN|nr:DUF2470 domain-containing protein [Streptomyces sp. B-S-A6]MDI3406886.1 DUF2470 domain-containing protein [Streptomyces sp. B-S-A6]